MLVCTSISIAISPTDSEQLIYRRVFPIQWSTSQSIVTAPNQTPSGGPWHLRTDNCPLGGRREF